MVEKIQAMRGILESLRNLEILFRHDSELDVHNLRQAQRFLKHFIDDVSDFEELKKESKGDEE